MDVTYFVNEYGFRGDWSLTNNKKKVLFIGCSVTFGNGLNYEDTFIKLISNELFPEHEVINLGMAGCSIDTNLRYFKYITDLIEIESAFFLLPFIFRSEFPTGNPTLPLVNFVNEIENIVPEHKTNFRSWVDLNTPQFMDYRLGKSISHIESISDHRKIDTYISTYDFDIYKSLDKFINSSKKLPPFIQYELESFRKNGNLGLGSEFARDGHHPGKYSHKVFSDSTIEFYKSKVNKLLN
jgi:hypothetical protein